ncbi:HEPN domain-containing protein [Acinetobacter baumannii]|uniref:HEPN domain-containing protein n=1 Tax=Acinetobacter baumannii TaxID=470 RepID=UPI003891ACAC
MHETEAFTKWKKNTQEIFDFSILVHYSVPALKQQINLVEKGKVNTLCRPDYYKSHKPDYYSSENLLTSLKSRMSGYKSHISDYLLLSLFSYFEAFIVDIIKEFLDFHGGIQQFQSYATRKSKHSIEIISYEKNIRKNKNKLKPTNAKNQPDRKHATRELKKINFKFPSDHFSSYGIFMLGKKIDELKARDIPEILINVLLLELTEFEIKEFHGIRDTRNKIAHGNTVHLNIKEVTEKNRTLMNLAKKVNKHICENFKIYENHYFN